MNRREFKKKMAAAAALSPWLWNIQLDQMQHEIIYPNPISKGDTIGLIAPSGFISDERLNRAIANVLDLGYKYKHSAELLNRTTGYLAGSDQDRIKEIHDMINDPEVAAIWCIRGGYGLTRIIDKLDYNLIKAKQKIILGYSDITALHIAVFQNTGLVCYHGPVASSTIKNYSKACIENIFRDPTKLSAITNPFSLKKRNSLYEYQIINPGHAEGQLIGGNLSIVNSLIGTKYQPDFFNKVVFLEDVDERPYRIDRMLTQLIDATNFKECNAIILGVFEGCIPKPEESSFSLHEVILEKFKDFNIPIVYGYSFGHTENCCILPVGMNVIFDSATGTVISSSDKN